MAKGGKDEEQKDKEKGKRMRQWQLKSKTADDKRT